MFRSSTIIRELALNLAKVIFMLKHSVKLRRYLLRGCVWTVPRLCEVYPGICLKTEEKARNNLSQGSRNENRIYTTEHT